MRGVVDFHTRWGMAFEPHLQNVYVALRAGMPSRVILRDLDSTILDPLRIRPLARANGVRLARERGSICRTLPPVVGDWLMP
jgi:siderophore synthetase component